MNRRQMKKQIPSDTDFCTCCPMYVNTGRRMEDVLMTNGQETPITRAVFICSYTKITTEENVDFDAHMKVCGEKTPSYN